MGLGDTDFAKMADLKKTALIPIEEEKYTDKGQLSTINLRTLLKIFNGHDGIRKRILDYLSRNTYEKPTPAITSQIMDINELTFEAKKWRKAFEEADELRGRYLDEKTRLEMRVELLEKENKALKERLREAGAAGLNNK